MDSNDFHDHLEAALVTRPVIEQAKGVLTGTRCATPEQAFAELRYVSQNHNVKLHELATALVDIAAGRDTDNPVLSKVIQHEWGNLFSC